MLSATLGANGGQMPLSPSAQATLSKHLPKLQTKRLMQQATTPNKPQTADASCLTGELCNCLTVINPLLITSICSHPHRFVQQRKFAGGGNIFIAGGTDTQIQSAKWFPHWFLWLCEWGLVCASSSAAHSSRGSRIDQGTD